MSTDEEEVNCPECGTTFKLWESGGYCPDTDCGMMHPQARQQPSNAISENESSIDDDTEEDADTGMDTEPSTEGNEDADGGRAEQPSVNDGDENADIEAESSGEVEDESSDADIETGSSGEIETGDQHIDCPNCDESISSDATFCRFCGTEVESAETSEPEGPPSCPNCGVDVDIDQSFCSECGTDLQADIDGEPSVSTPDHNTDSTPEATGGGAAQSSSQQEIKLDIDGERIDVNDGDFVGSEIRQALVDTGGSHDEALHIHREHIEFDVRDNGVYLIDHGKNTTRVTGNTLSAGDEQQLKDGDTIELSEVVEATVHIS